MDATLTCFHTLLLEVGAAAEVVLTVAVTPASRRLRLLQLEAPPLAGASGGVPLRADWKRGEGRVSKNEPQGDASHMDSGGLASGTTAGSSGPLAQSRVIVFISTTADRHPVTLSVINWLVLPVYKSGISRRERSADASSPQAERKQDLHRTTEQTSPKGPENIYQMRFSNICSRRTSRWTFFFSSSQKRACRQTGWCKRFQDVQNKHTVEMKLTRSSPNRKISLLFWSKRPDTEWVQANSWRNYELADQRKIWRVFVLQTVATFCVYIVRLLVFCLNFCYFDVMLNCVLVSSVCNDANVAAVA